MSEPPDDLFRAADRREEAARKAPPAPAALASLPVTRVDPRYLASTGNLVVFGLWRNRKLVRTIADRLLGRGGAYNPYHWRGERGRLRTYLIKQLGLPADEADCELACLSDAIDAEIRRSTGDEGGSAA